MRYNSPKDKLPIYSRVPGERDTAQKEDLVLLPEAHTISIPHSTQPTHGGKIRHIEGKPTLIHYFACLADLRFRVPPARFDLILTRYLRS